MVIMAGLLGIGLGIIFTFIREYVQNSDEEEQEKFAEVKSLFYHNIIKLIPFKKNGKD